MNKMSIRQRFSVTARGFRILKQYCPGLAQGKVLYELINSLQPFASVWFSAQIINEISEKRRLKIVCIYVVSVLLVNFMCSVFKSIVDRVCSEKESQMWSWFGKIFADKQMSLDYVDLEDVKIQHRSRTQRKISTCLRMVWGSLCGELQRLSELPLM